MRKTIGMYIIATLLVPTYVVIFLIRGKNILRWWKNNWVTI